MIRRILSKNKVVQRAKAIKDLILEKLDALILTSNSQVDLANKLLNEHQERLFNLDTLLGNSMFILRASNDMLVGLQRLLDVSNYHNDANQKKLINIEEVAQEQKEIIIQKSEEIKSSIALINETISYAIDIENERTKLQNEDLIHRSSSILTEVQSNKELIQHTSSMLTEIQLQIKSVDQSFAHIYSEAKNQKSKKIIIDQSYFYDVDTELMCFLYSFLPHHRAIDIGANQGNVAARLLQTGYEVYAFEPYPPILDKLTKRLSSIHNFHAFSFALGSTNETKDLYIAIDKTENQVYEDPSVYSSLTQHSLSEGLAFTQTLPVDVKTLSSLHESGEIPSDIGLVKIDTEGFDLEVIRGMGNYTYPVVVAEFWDNQFPFGRSGAKNYLTDLVVEMKSRNYHWNIVIYRIWGSTEVSYYCNSSYSIENSWGNVFFFQDYEVFNKAMKWCASMMPATHFSP